MSEAATETAAPAAPAAEAAPAQETATPAAAPGNRSRARDLAGKFLSGGQLDMPTPEVPAPAAEKPTEKAVEAAAEPEKPEPEKAKTLAEDPEEKSWREIRRRKKQQRDAHAAIEKQRVELAAEKAQHDVWRAEKLADEELKAKDPPAWLEKHRFDFREVALREVQKQQLTPEQKAAKDEFDAIRAELAAEKDAREKAEKDASDVLTEFRKEREAKKQQDALAAIHKETQGEWGQAQGEFPTLAAYYTPEEISEAATQLRLDHYRKTQQEAPLEEVFSFMEKNAAREHQRFSRQLAADRTERDTVAADKAAKTRAKVGPPVTNRAAATRASPDTPLTDAEKRARAVAKAAEAMGPRH